MNNVPQNATQKNLLHIRTLRCRSCGAEEFITVDSRAVRGSRRRRHECINCKKRMTTYEVSEEDFKRFIQSSNSTASALEGLMHIIEDDTRHTFDGCISKRFLLRTINEMINGQY